MLYFCAMINVPGLLIFLFISMFNFPFHGTHWDNDAAGHYSDSITVYVFMSDECIICMDYASYINKLYNLYSTDNVTFVGVFPNFASKKDKIESFKKKYNFAFEMKTDYFKKRVSKFDVQVTPEVVIYDEKKEKTLYQGRIDNSFYALGKRRRVVTKFDLEDALISIAKQEKIKIPKTEAIGCFINQTDNISN